MTSSDYIRAYGMKRRGGHYEKQMEKDGNIIYLSLYRMELINECYFVRQTFYKHKLDPTTQTYGVMGKANFTFGIKNNTFNTLDLVEEERGL